MRLKRTKVFKKDGKLMKKCPSCLVDKASENFYICDVKDIPKGRCKECRKVYDTEWRAKNREKWNNYHRSYRELNRKISI